MIVASFLDNKPNSLLFDIFSFNLPLTSSKFLYNSSIEPYSLRNFFAVFSPTPGRPGILSTESPIIPKKSITCSGSLISNLFFTSSTPQISIPLPNRAGLYKKIFSETNCAKSLSGVTMYVIKPSFSACFATVPITSSAS